MRRNFHWRAARTLAASLLLAAALAWAVPRVIAQGTTQEPAQPTPQGEKTAAAQATRPQAGVAAPADEPLYTEFKGVRLGASQDEARKRLGTPQEKDKTQDFFLLSDRQRARVYYDDKGAVSAIIVTYVGKSPEVPTPESILGSGVESKQDGSMYKLVNYPKAGYWVAYSRTPGDEPLTIITMQRMNR